MSRIATVRFRRRVFASERYGRTSALQDLFQSAELSEMPYTEG
jgi:hypothetical protein